MEPASPIAPLFTLEDLNESAKEGYLLWEREVLTPLQEDESFKVENVPFFRKVKSIDSNEASIPLCVLKGATLVHASNPNDLYEGGSLLSKVIEETKNKDAFRDCHIEAIVHYLYFLFSINDDHLSNTLTQFLPTIALTIHQQSYWSFLNIIMGFFMLERVESNDPGEDAYLGLFGLSSSHEKFTPYAALAKHFLEKAAYPSARHPQGHHLAQLFLGYFYITQLKLYDPKNLEEQNLDNTLIHKAIGWFKLAAMKNNAKALQCIEAAKIYADEAQISLDSIPTAF